MHTPVAAVPGVAHLVPSVAPLAHTNETKRNQGFIVPTANGVRTGHETQGRCGRGISLRARRPRGTWRSGEPLWTLCARWTSRPLWTRHGLAASADCQHREKGKTVQKLPHRQTLQQCATACIHQLSTVKKPKVCDVRFGSEADISAAISDVRFTPNSDRESGLPQKVMSALPPKADICGATRDVRFGPIAASRGCSDGPNWVRRAGTIRRLAGCFR
jgi:hypothetical protein